MATATVAECLRIAPEFRGDEHDEIRDRLSAKLDARLRGFREDQVELEVSVKDRDSSQQKVTLEAWISTKGPSHFVATATDGDVQAALSHARDELHRQIDRFLNKRQQSNRR